MDSQDFEQQSVDGKLWPCFDWSDPLSRGWWQSLVQNYDWEWITVPPLQAWNKTAKLTMKTFEFNDQTFAFIANVVKEKLERFKWGMLYDPPYSPKHTVCNWYTFKQVKKQIKRSRFASDDDLEESTGVLKQQTKEFYGKGITLLGTQWIKCPNDNGDWF